MSRRVQQGDNAGDATTSSYYRGPCRSTTRVHLASNHSDLTANTSPAETCLATRTFVHSQAIRLSSLPSVPMRTDTPSAQQSESSSTNAESTDKAEADTKAPLKMKPPYECPPEQDTFYCEDCGGPKEKLPYKSDQEPNGICIGVSAIPVAELLVPDCQPEKPVSAIASSAYSAINPANAPGSGDNDVYDSGKMAGIFVGAEVLTFAVMVSLVWLCLEWFGISLRELRTEWTHAPTQQKKDGGDERKKDRWGMLRRKSKANSGENKEVKSEKEIVEPPKDLGRSSVISSGTSVIQKPVKAGGGHDGEASNDEQATRRRGTREPDLERQ
ncbi:hypothetical protein EK21DRAFT_92012 [Setomelanomma holmii]|uniref:Uncharacterized protein n=1 Tax=Setomelanomma holmii TaxID=210430 RepID=A0A9P4H568_9PLEO|nr:hypothetical protein EK21DRAFT_92012 [Setomelanomma holmii]